MVQNQNLLNLGSANNKALKFIVRAPGFVNEMPKTIAHVFKTRYIFLKLTQGNILLSPTAL